MNCEADLALCAGGNTTRCLRGCCFAKRHNHPGKLDTGAEHCCFYEGFLLALDIDDARVIEERVFSGLTGNAVFPIYETHFFIGGKRFDTDVVAGKQPRNVIGMDVLNQLLAEFNGPAQQVTLHL